MIILVFETFLFVLSSFHNGLGWVGLLVSLATFTYIVVLMEFVTIFLATSYEIFFLCAISDNLFFFFHTSHSFELAVWFVQFCSCSQSIWSILLSPYLLHTKGLVHFSLRHLWQL